MSNLKTPNQKSSKLMKKTSGFWPGIKCVDSWTTLYQFSSRILFSCHWRQHLPFWRIWRGDTFFNAGFPSGCIFYPLLRIQHDKHVLHCPSPRSSFHYGSRFDKGLWLLCPSSAYCFIDHFFNVSCLNGVWMRTM